jgi:hypothetical protein
MARQVKQRINLGDAYPLRSVSNLHNLISRTDLAFVDYPEIESRPPMGNKQGWHLRIAHANANAVASYSRLGHLEYRITNPVTIADADLVVGKAVYCQVLAKLSILEVVPLKVILPVAIGIELIHHHCAMFPAMSL